MNALAVVGDEVWAGWDSHIERFALDGTYLGSFYGEDTAVNALAVVGDEVWAGWGSDIERYALDGTYLGSFYGEDQFVNALAVVPEPLTVIPTALGFLLLLRSPERKR